MGYLDLTGLSNFWTKAKAWISERYTPNTRKINGKVLSADITLSAADVSAIPASQKGAANGVASLDSAGKVPSAQLPSYVDDVLEGYMSGGKFYAEAAHTTEITGETGKIYTDLSTNKTYRWSGTAFVEISASLALGETSSTAFAGDKGKTAYAHSQSAHARTDATKTEASATNGNVKINGTETKVYEHPATAGNKHIPSGGSSGQILRWGADGTAVWGADNDTKYSAFGGATASAAGKEGLVPAPTAGSQNKFLAGDGTFKAPPSVTAITTAEIDTLFTA